MDENAIRDFVHSEIEKVREHFTLSERIATLEAQHHAKEKALELIAISLADYKTTANEWRGTVQDITGKCITRLEAQAVFDRINDAIQRLEKAKNESAGKSSGSMAVWAIIGTLAFIVLGLAGLLLRVGH